MKYYQIIASDKKKVIGHYPQTYFHNESNNVCRKIRHDTFENTEPKLVIKLHQNSIETDLLNRVGVYFGLFVSEDFKKELSGLVLPEHRFYPIQIKWGKHIRQEYYWLHYYDDIFKYIDFTKTEFEFFNSSDFRTIETVKIKSKEDFLRHKSEENWEKVFRARNIVLNKNFSNFDIFNINLINADDIISEKLADKLIYSRLTGFELKEYDFIKFS